MNIKKEMHSPESTTTPDLGSKAQYSANIVLQDSEEDDEKTLSSNLNKTTRDDSEYSESESDKSTTLTQQITSPRESEGALKRSGEEVRSLIYTFMP